MSTTPVYLTSPSGKRIGAQLESCTPEGAEPMVCVWFTNGNIIGWYRLSRFEGGRVTPATVRAVLWPTKTTEGVAA